MSALARIFETKRAEVEEAKQLMPLEQIRAQAGDAEPPRGFLTALQAAAPQMGLIAEVKKASPSKGLIREDFHPVEIAKAYERAGAHALSVLTDKPHFHGRPEYLGEARAATKLPVLRKDFILDEYQIYESRTWGADAILLIVAGLEMMQIVEFHSLARELGMDVLVEVHTDQEAQIAIELGCHFIGVNNRDLATFQTSLETSDKILSMIADQAFAVSESALETQKDVERVRRAGAKAVLIGTTFCAAPDVESKVREVMGW